MHEGPTTGRPRNGGHESALTFQQAPRAGALHGHPRERGGGGGRREARLTRADEAGDDGLGFLRTFGEQSGLVVILGPVTPVQRVVARQDSGFPRVWDYAGTLQSRCQVPRPPSAF
jgi:hypothetical protein